MGLSSDFYPPPESEDPTENKRCGPQDKTLHLNRNSEGQDEDISDLPRLGDQLLNQGQNLDRARPSICVQPDDNSADRPSKRKHDQVKSDELAIDAEETNPSRPLRPESHRADLVSEHSVKRLRSDLQAPSSSRNDVELSDSLEANYTLHRLTVPIWQRIFCFVPPVFLGRLLRVDRAFHSLLKSPEPYNYTLEHRIEDFRNPSAELIWTASRKRFAPGLPKALFGQSELDMWRLLRGNSCQVCGERKSLLTTSAMSDPWHAGPGETGIRVIWSFGVRCCGPCLLKSSEQEVNLLFSSAFPSFLLPALPCAYITPSQDYITASTIRSISLPSDIQMAKYYYKPHVQEIKRRFEDVKLLGSGSAEEWIKGLESEGKDRSQDPVRWEQWEAKGGLRKVNTRPNTRTAVGTRGKSASTTSTVNGPPPRYGLDSSGPGKTTEVPSNPPETTPTSISGQNPSSPFHHSHPVTTFPLSSLPQRPHVPIPQVRQDRNIRSVNEAKAVRRAEIERRCLELDPPIEPGVLCHMESFQAALQISTPLTDNAWNVLKPRLLSQRETAERCERQRLEQNRISEAKSEERKQEDSQLKEAKDVQDREWDLAQAPIRNRLAEYADEVIWDVWSGGAKVTKDNCSKFAADVLVNCRQRFYQDLAQEGAAARGANKFTKPPSPNHGPSQGLNLENMKWLFDNKIKTITEKFQKELFLCNGCEGNFKFYGFEAVIQHYAAKHTSALSRGSVVVHWRADWPEQPPFHPNPSSAKAAYYAVPMPLATNGPPQYSRPAEMSARYEEYGQGLKPVAPITSNVFDANSHPGGQYTQHQQGQFQFPGVVQHPLPGISPPGPDYYSSYRTPTLYPAIPENAYLHEPMVAHGPNLRVIPNFSVVPPNPMHYSTLATPGHSIPLAGPEQYYQTQMNEMAKHARDVWFGTSGIKDIPQSVRIYVVIQHVVSRFEQKYTNEPSLSMFIDGLDHNSLMRPVRSLNGLACKACVASATNVNAEFHSHPLHSTSERKLFTLPHLLNHFKSVHVEKARLVVDLHSAMEATRLDWKRDMIELPETPLITDLINAPGMDDTKIQLIAKVFPGIFPDPLPPLGSVMSAGPVPRYQPDRFDQSERQRSEQPMSGSLIPHHLNIPGSPIDIASPRPQSRLRTHSRSSPRASEPPGEDEYDPNRPAYLGRIVEPYHMGPARQKSLIHGPINERLGQEIDFQLHAQREAPNEVQNRTKGAYGNQLLRHHDRSIEQVSDELEISDQGIAEHGQMGTEGRRTELTRGKSARNSFSGTPPPKAEIAAADKFLDDLTPAIASIRRDRDNTRGGRGLSDQLSTWDKHVRRLSLPKHDQMGNSLRVDTLAEPSARTTPSYTEHSENRNASSLQALASHLEHSDRHRSMPRVQYIYADDGKSFKKSSSYDYNQRVPSSLYPMDPESSCTSDLSRSFAEPAMWSRVIHPRERSMSPRPSSGDFAHRQIRSPLPPIQRDAAYRMRSPPDSTLSETRQQRAVQYSYPPVHDRHEREDDFAQNVRDGRLEYVISPEHTSGRYVITHPPGNQVSSELFHLERDYEPQRIYERHGVLYYAETQPYSVRTRQQLEPEYVEYRDYR